MTGISRIGRLRDRKSDQQKNKQQAKDRVDLAKSMVQKALSTPEPDRSLLAQALDIYHAALNKHPSLLEPYLAIAYIAWQFYQYEEAVRLLKTALTISPGNERAERMLAAIKKEYVVNDVTHQIQSAASSALEEKEKPQGGGLKDAITRSTSSYGKKDDFFAMLQQAKKKK